MVSQVKLIAEPWDLGEGGYQVGNFPTLWSEWNGRYRDTVRDYWRGADQTLADFAYRLTGSSDLYEPTGRRPYASVNFVTAHDGFTLADLVSYDGKHNEANGEDNRDGPTTTARGTAASKARPTTRTSTSPRAPPPRPDGHAAAQPGRAHAAGTATSSATPSGGNNNAYCQDNEISWLDWEHADTEFLDFCAQLVAFRHRHPVFRRRRFFEGEPIFGAELSDIGWFRPDGAEMTDDDWQAGSPSRSGSSSTATRCPTRTRAAAGSPTTASCCSSTPTTARSPSRSPAGSGASYG